MSDFIETQRHQQRWRIAWRSRVTGAEGRGEAIFDSPEQAQQMCDKANHKWPELEHWLEPAA